MNERAMELLKVFELDEEANTISANLPYGKQRKLADGKSYGNYLNFYCLMEPAAGIEP